MGKTAQSIDECPGRCIDASECVGTYEKITSDPCFIPGTKDIDNSVVCCVGV
jgi:hypothetical protein